MCVSVHLRPTGRRDAPASRHGNILADINDQATWASRRAYAVRGFVGLNGEVLRESIEALATHPM